MYYGLVAIHQAIYDRVLLMRGNETIDNALLEDWQKQRILLKLVLRGYNQIIAEFALLSVNYESVEEANIFLSGTEPISNK